MRTKKPREEAGTPPHSQREVSPLLMALEVCGLAPGTEPYRANYRTFSGTMLRLGMERSMEIVRTFASELARRPAPRPVLQLRHPRRCGRMAAWQKEAHSRVSVSAASAWSWHKRKESE